jgi:uncharacterized delta-60 repeat protein
MRKILLLMLSLAILDLATGVAQAQGAGRLDSGFGDGGKVTLPRPFEATRNTVQLADGRIVLSRRDGLVAVLPSGQIDSGFGAGGFAPLPLPPGATQADIADVLVDSQGRLIAVSNCSFPASGPNGTEGSRLETLAERFHPDGNFDRSFGEGGFATSDFGVQPPEGGRPPSVLARYAAVDHAGRIVVAAQRLVGNYLYKGIFIDRYEAFVARFGAEGAVDGSFASNGVLPVPNDETLGRPVVDAQSGFYLPAFPGGKEVLMHIGASGQPDPGFGQDGRRPMPAGTASPITLDDGGRLLVYGYLQGRRHRLPNGILIKRLLPNGLLDRSFGRGGAISFRMPRLYTVQVALDERGRILVGAALKKQSAKGQRSPLPAGMALARLRPGGALDLSFGRRGIVVIPFPHTVEMNIESLSVEGGAAVLGGGRCGTGSCSNVLARVALGSG